MVKPLEGHRVLDLTHVLAGPYCTYQLGLLGAEVIKVESGQGDMVRMWGGSEEQLKLKLGSGFVPQNAGKKSLCIDLNTKNAREILKRLAGSADIFVENYEPGTMQKFGLAYDEIRDINPGIIYCSISAFGRNGPDSHRPGFDDVVQATSGYMSVNVRGDGPIRTGGPVLDYSTGMHAASAILAAILLKAKTGEGQYVDIAMQDVTMLLLNRNTSIAATTGEAPTPAGNRDAPLLGRYQTKDGFVMLAGYLPAHCRAICNAIGLDEYGDLPGRVFAEKTEEIEAAVEARLKTKTSAAWDGIFSRERVVAGGVKDLNQVLESGQPQARELLATVDSAAGPQQVTTAGYRINETVYAPIGKVPQLGEHTAEVLAEAGLTEQEITDLKDQRVIFEP